MTEMNDMEWKEACFSWNRIVRDFETILKYGEGKLQFGDFVLCYERATIPPVVESNYVIKEVNKRIIGEYGDDLEEAMSQMVFLLATSDIKHLGF